MSYRYISNSATDNETITAQILQRFSDARIFLLVGDLGAGKTTLTKSFCKNLGVTEAVTSPTFSIVNEYQGADKLIYHFDFYRIKEETEVFDMGYEEYFYSGNYCFIEWSEKIPNLIPDGAVLVSLLTNADESREIVVRMPQSSDN